MTLEDRLGGLERPGEPVCGLCQIGEPGTIEKRRKSPAGGTERGIPVFLVDQVAERGNEVALSDSKIYDFPCLTDFLIPVPDQTRGR